MREKEPAPPEDDPMQVLLDVLEAENEGNEPDNDITEHPHRVRSQPNYYQSDAIENEEKLARHGKDKASSSNSSI